METFTTRDFALILVSIDREVSRYEDVVEGRTNTFSIDYALTKIDELKAVTKKIERMKVSMLGQPEGFLKL